MDPQQALQFLMQVLVTKPGLSIQDCANAVQAWNVIAEAVTPKPIPEKVNGKEPEKKDK
jgi:hypothetical protein